MAAVCLLLAASAAHAQEASSPVSLLDVPYISQSEALCGGAAAAMVLRYWGERSLSAESFAHLVDRSAAGIRTEALAADIAGRGWTATAVAGDEMLARTELARGRPVLALIHDRPGTFHYIVIVAWQEHGIVFHDPARAPFRVMAREEFRRRWQAARSWMLIVTPGAGANRRDVVPDPVPTPGSRDNHSCEERVAAGIRAAQANDLDAAERTLTAALACPGPAASRELAGVRLLQRRWPEVTELAATAVAIDPRDSYAWKLLGTSRFVQDDTDGALEAWNRVGEPRLDLVRIDGLSRTRHPVVERLLGLERGEVLTPHTMLRARRRLLELPAAASARLEFVPVSSGLAEVRGAVNERPLFPTSALAYAGVGLSAAATRELRVGLGSAAGGGELLGFGWRFWPERPRVGISARAPAPWGGIWAVDAEWERQALDLPGSRALEHQAVHMSVSDWASSRLRWEVNGGVEHRPGAGRYAVVGGATMLATPRDRLVVHAGSLAWIGETRFAMGQVSVTGRSSAERRGFVGVVSGTFQAITAPAPLDLWLAGDVGHARTTLLRAHPVLDNGRLRVSRLGRVLANGSAEGQRWWPLRGVLRIAVAAFVDTARTGSRLEGPALREIDVGVGARLAGVGVPGTFRADLGKGVNDGNFTLSLTYVP
jgi:predicted double-glycine peptidase